MMKLIHLSSSLHRQLDELTEAGDGWVQGESFWPWSEGPTDAACPPVAPLCQKYQAGN